METSPASESSSSSTPDELDLAIAAAFAKVALSRQPIVKDASDCFITRKPRLARESSTPVETKTQRRMREYHEALERVKSRMYETQGDFGSYTFIAPSTSTIFRTAWELCQLSVVECMSYFGLTVSPTRAIELRMVAPYSGQLTSLPHLGTGTACISDGVHVYVYFLGRGLFKAHVTNFTGKIESVNSYIKAVVQHNAMQAAKPVDPDKPRSKSPRVPTPEECFCTLTPSQLADKWL